MFGREDKDPAAEHELETEDVFEPDPAAVDLEPEPPEPVLKALRKIRIRRTGKVMTVGGEHARILVDARRAEYIDG